jgi:hypothetical protein
MAENNEGERIPVDVKDIMGDDAPGGDEGTADEPAPAAAPETPATPAAPEAPKPDAGPPAAAPEAAGKPQSAPAAQPAPQAAAPAPDAELRRQLSEQAAELAELRRVKQQYEVHQKNAPAPAPTDIFSSAEELADFMTDPKKASEVLAKVRETAVQDAISIMSAHTAQQIEIRMETREAESEFLRANQDLAAFKPLLYQFSLQVGSEHPEWLQKRDLKSIFEETGKRTRAFLQLQAGQPGAAAGSTAAPSATPGFAPGTGTRKAPGGTVSPSKQMLAEVFSDD